ncbi:MAG TPA: hypothetical protein DEF61_00450 [Firmicutes bacterium]|nr:hypothetical protein [Bacillota bacterium]HBX24764.1 hypothetical protein [Bacillota bacterium]
MTKPIRIDNETEYLQKASNVPSDLLANSFNKNSTISKNTKLVIVGTLTPPDTAYFYCSFYNRIYGYIDEAINNLGRNNAITLKELKIGLAKVHNKRTNINLCEKNKVEKKVNLIKEILSKNKIAFLDVMDKAIRRKKTPYDHDIEFYKLAKNDLRKISPSMTTIANSKLAKECLDSIGIKSTLLSQRADKKSKWIEMIEKTIK